MALTLFSTTGFGQVTFKSVTTSDGFMGMGAFESTTKTFVVDYAQRTETDLKFTGSFMKYMKTNMDEISIIRLDKKLVWNIDKEKETYKERTFAEIKDMMAQGFSGAGQPMPEEQTDYEADYEWSKPKIKVKDQKESKKINGFKCDHYTVSVTTIGTHVETGIKDTMLFVSGLWNAKAVTKNMQLVYDFNKKYLDAIGIEIPENAGMAMIAGMYKDQMNSLQDEIQKLDGYPIVNDMKLTMTRNTMPAPEKQEENITLRDIQRDFGGLLGKKVLKDAKKDKEKTDDSVFQMLRIKNEVVEISSDNIPKTKFEVKEGYKLKK